MPLWEESRLLRLGKQMIRKQRRFWRSISQLQGEISVHLSGREVSRLVSLGEEIKSFPTKMKSIFWKLRCPDHETEMWEILRQR